MNSPIEINLGPRQIPSVPEKASHWYEKNRRLQLRGDRGDRGRSRYRRAVNVRDNPPRPPRP